MPSLLTICDTNIYRGNNQTSFEHIRQLERKHSIVGVASQWVVAELLSHLADEKDQAFGSAWSAARSLHAHTSIWKRGVTLPVLSSPRDSLAREIFGHRDQSALTQIDWLAKTLQFIAEAKTVDEVLRYRANAVAAGKHLAEHEIQFGRAMTEGRASLSPRKSEALRLLKDHGVQFAAERVLREIEQATNNKLEEPRRGWVIQNIMLVIPTSLYLFRNIVISSLENDLDFDKTKHRNSLWDAEIAMYITRAFGGNDPLIGNAPILVVTEERSIHRAAAEAGQEKHVMTFATYRDTLENGHTELLPV